jgi:glycine dehydrogenase
MKTDSFALRHLGPRDQDLPKMLETIGVESLDLINERLFQLTFG